MKFYQLVTIAWHWLTTSRYTLYLETDNAELRKRVALLEAALIPRLAVLEAQSQDREREAEKRENPALIAAPVVNVCHDCTAKYTGPRCPECGAVAPIKAITRTRYKSFSAIKRELESQETRTQ